MTGLLGGGHAIYWDGTDAWNLDCFVDVPSGTGAPPVELKVPFGEELVHYAVGPGTCAVPGLPRGLGALHARFGRLPWARVVEPALGIARSGVTMPPAHAACLAMLAPVFTMQPDGRRIYAPDGLAARGGRAARPAWARPSARAPGGGGAGQPLRRLDRRVAALRRRGDRGVAGRPGGLRAPLGAPGGGRLGRAPVPHPQRALRRPGDARAPATAPGARRHSARAGAARRARRARRRGPHDEPRHNRLRRERVRPDVQPRARHGRLPPRPRPAAEQHARRGRPRPRAARGRQADAEHDGSEPGSRRAKGSRWRSAPRAARACAPRSSASRPGSSTRGSTRRAPSGVHASTAPATSSTPSPVSTSRRWRSSKRKACACGAGRRSTTTSAGSAWWRGPAPPAIRGEAATQRHPAR